MIRNALTSIRIPVFHPSNKWYLMLNQESLVALKEAPNHSIIPPLLVLCLRPPRAGHRLLAFFVLGTGTDQPLLPTERQIARAISHHWGHRRMAAVAFSRKKKGGTEWTTQMGPMPP